MASGQAANGGCLYPIKKLIGGRLGVVVTSDASSVAPRQVFEEYFGLLVSQRHLSLLPALARLSDSSWLGMAQGAGIHCRMIHCWPQSCRRLFCSCPMATSASDAVRTYRVDSDPISLSLWVCCNLARKERTKVFAFIRRRTCELSGDR